MRIILSHPTRHGGSLTFSGPVSGVAFVAFPSGVYRVRLIAAEMREFADIVMDGNRLGDGEVWFEDDRERSH